MGENMHTPCPKCTSSLAWSTCPFCAAPANWVRVDGAAPAGLALARMVVEMDDADSPLTGHLDWRGIITAARALIADAEGT